MWQSPRRVAECAVFIVVLLAREIVAECEENIITPLKTHIVPDAIKYFRGNFTDVWASRYITEMLNSSFTVIEEDGTTTNYVISKDGEGSSATGKLWADEEGVIHLKVEGFDCPGIIYPVFASPNVIAYYTCYPKVPGEGVSVIAARWDRYFLPTSLEHVTEAKVVFSTLQELGIPINDGVDYVHGT